MVGTGRGWLRGRILLVMAILVIILLILIILVIRRIMDMILVAVQELRQGVKIS